MLTRAARMNPSALRHTGMPWGIASDLRGVIGDQHPFEAIAMQYGEHADHVDLTIVNEGFAILRYPAGDVAEVNVAEPLVAAVRLNPRVEVVSGHLSSVPRQNPNLLLGLKTSRQKLVVRLV
jgi:hypothetical protein